MNLKHHSLADWDFLKRSDWSPFTRYDLFPYFCVSPPTCLRFELHAVDVEQYALSNLPLAQDLKAGRMTTWGRAEGAGVGSSYMYIGVTGPGSQGLRFSISKSWTQFKRNRIDWWQGYDGVGNPATLVSKYNWDGTKWLLTSTGTYAPMTGAVNRVGIGCTGQSLANDKYFDDTEIWLPI